MYYNSMNLRAKRVMKFIIDVAHFLHRPLTFNVNNHKVIIKLFSQSQL